MIDRIIKMRRKFDLTDVMTKSMVNIDLLQGMDNGRIHFEIENSITKTKQYQKQKKTKIASLRTKKVKLSLRYELILVSRTIDNTPIEEVNL